MQCVVCDRLVTEAVTRTRVRNGFLRAPRPQFGVGGHGSGGRYWRARVLPAPSALARAWSLGIRERSTWIGFARRSLEGGASHDRGDERCSLIVPRSHQI